MDAKSVSELALRREAHSSASQEHGARYPQSFAQQRLWFLNLVAPTDTSYNLVGAFRVEGRIDTGALSLALIDLEIRHEILRTVYPSTEPIQIVRAPGAARVEIQEFAEPRDINAALARIACAPFNLDRDPIIRLDVLRLPDNVDVLVVTVHHIACDRLSWRILLHELGIFYTSRLTGIEHALEPLQVQYGEYSLQELELATDGSVEADLDYWRQQLMPPLPQVRFQPASSWHSGPGALTSEWPEHVVAGLRELCHEANASFFTGIVAVLAVALSPYSTRGQIMFGCPVSLRDSKTTESLIGLLINVVPLRIRLHPGSSFIDFLGSARETMLDALEHGRVPFQRLIQEIKPARGDLRQPLYQVSLNLVDGKDEQPPQLGDLPVFSIDVPEPGARQDLSLMITEHGLALDLKHRYDRSRVFEGTIKAFANASARIAAEAATHPEARLDDLLLRAISS